MERFRLGAGFALPCVIFQGRGRQNCARYLGLAKIRFRSEATKLRVERESATGMQVTSFARLLLSMTFSISKEGNASTSTTMWLIDSDGIFAQKQFLTERTHPW